MIFVAQKKILINLLIVKKDDLHYYYKRNKFSFSFDSYDKYNFQSVLISYQKMDNYPLNFTNLSYVDKLNKYLKDSLLKKYEISDLLYSMKGSMYKKRSIMRLPIEIISVIIKYLNKEDAFNFSITNCSYYSLNGCLQPTDIRTINIEDFDFDRVESSKHCVDVSYPHEYGSRHEVTDSNMYETVINKWFENKQQYGELQIRSMKGEFTNYQKSGERYDLKFTINYPYFVKNENGFISRSTLERNVDKVLLLKDDEMSGYGESGFCWLKAMKEDKRSSLRKVYGPFISRSNFVKLFESMGDKSLRFKVSHGSFQHIEISDKEDSIGHEKMMRIVDFYYQKQIKYIGYNEELIELMGHKLYHNNEGKKN